MATPTAAYSIRLRVRLDNRPGTLGRLATAIGDVGGNITAIGGFDVRGAHLDEDVLVNCSLRGAHRAGDRGGARRRRRRGARGRRPHLRDARGRQDRGARPHADRRPRRPVDGLHARAWPGSAPPSSSSPALAHELTIKKNTVAIVTDGTAVLGLGDIGPAGALPVMEGKALLFKNFAGVDAFPICLDVTTPDEIVETVVRIAPVFGGINLEDIAAPACFEIEDRLKELLDIPVFHDDQHGTAVVALAALENALRIVDKPMGSLRVVIAGVGAAGRRHQQDPPRGRRGRDHRRRPQGRDLGGPRRPQRRQALVRRAHQPGAPRGHPRRGAARAPTCSSASPGPGLITASDLRQMAPDPIVFAMANPDPEIRPEEADGLAAVIATGRSDYPNQINNVLAFPGIFRGALDVAATSITEGMKLAAARAIAEVVGDDVRPDYIVPSVFDTRVGPLVAEYVAEAAVAEGVCRTALA